MRKSTISFIVLLSMLSGSVLWSCLEPYAPPKRGNQVNFLVIDGMLNGSDGSVNVRLTRAKPLDDQGEYEVVTTANVYVEDEDGDQFFLSEVGNGNYARAASPINLDKKYKLVVIIDSKIYESTLIAIQKSPAIDSITWVPELDGTEISITTHDPSKQTQYYRWILNETWEYRAAFNSRYKIENGTPTIRYDNIYRCWQSQMGSTILVASTTRLNEDIVYKFPINFIPKGDPRLFVKYSVLVKQYGLSKEAFEFWEELKKNTENLGTLFDPQPSQTIGNVFSKTNSDEQVLGYFSASTVQEERFTLWNRDLPEDLSIGAFYPGCEADTVFLVNLPSFNSNQYQLLDQVYSVFGILLGYRYAEINCSDCRTGDGTNEMPPYWE